MGVNNFGFPRQAIPDSEKTQEWCEDNLKAITKKNIELHAAKISQISDFIDKILRSDEMAGY